MIPRDYQRAAVAAAREKTTAHGDTLLMLPVAAGKTCIAGLYIAEEAADDPASRFLVLQHTDELIEQNRATIGRITSLPGSIVKAERDDWSGQVVFGSVQTLARSSRRARMAPVSHLVIDECHRAAADSYQAIIGHARSLRDGVKLLGLSATPERGDGRSLRRTFSNVGFQVPIASLIEQGILVPPRTYTIDLGVGDELAAIDETAGDFDMSEAAAVLNHEVLNEAVVEHWQRRAADRRTIAFCSTIEHAEAVAAAFRAAGVTAETISGEMPARARAHRIARFDRGEVQVLTNCMVLTEGFDSQPIGCIVILRPMRHKGTFIQAVGRGLRKVDPERFPGIVKTDCIVLDFAGAASRHGSIEQDVRLADEEGEASGSVAYKVCPDCAAELPLGAPVCPFCGHVWQRRIQEKRLLEAFDLTEIDLLNRSPFRWCDLFGDDHALVASGFDAWGGVFFDGQHWHAVGKPRRGRLRHVAVGTRTQVLAAADDYLREIESTAAASKSRRWLEDPATAKQVELLQRAGYPVSAFDFGLSKYAANCHLSFVWNQAAIKAAVFGAELGRAA
jgi:superfamily II DNA or RNA helicase